MKPGQSDAETNRPIPARDPREAPASVARATAAVGAVGGSKGDFRSLHALVESLPAGALVVMPTEWVSYPFWRALEQKKAWPPEWLWRA